MESSQAAEASAATAPPTDLDPQGPWALAGGRWFWGQPALSDDLSEVGDSGTWVVCLSAEGSIVAARFPHSAPAAAPPGAGPSSAPEALPPPLGEGAAEGAEIRGARP